MYLLYLFVSPLSTGRASVVMVTFLKSLLPPCLLSASLFERGTSSQKTLSSSQTLSRSSKSGFLRRSRILRSSSISLIFLLRISSSSEELSEELSSPSFFRRSLRRPPSSFLQICSQVYLYHFLGLTQRLKTASGVLLFWPWLKAPEANMLMVSSGWASANFVLTKAKLR